MKTVMICPLWSHAMIKFSARYLMLTPLPTKGLSLFVWKLSGILQRSPPKRDYIRDWSIGGTVRSLRQIKSGVRSNFVWLTIFYILLNKHTIVRRLRKTQIMQNLCFQLSTSCFRWILITCILAAMMTVPWQKLLLISLLRSFQKYAFLFWILILVLYLFLLLRAQLVPLPSTNWTAVLFINCYLVDKKVLLFGPLPACVLKECCDTLLPIFTRIINCSLSHGVMLGSLRVLCLLPLLKNKNADHEIFSNFCPISNLKLISKLIEKAVASQLTDYLPFNNLCGSFQSAYKRYHSSETALLWVHNDILQSFDNGGGVLLVLLDLSAAFDTVNHELLLFRLSTYHGLCGLVLNWFTSYLTNRAQFMDVNGSFSTIHHLRDWVPQGLVLSP